MKLKEFEVAVKAIEVEDKDVMLKMALSILQLEETLAEEGGNIPKVVDRIAELLTFAFLYAVKNGI